MQSGVFVCSIELLAQALHLPPGTTIRQVETMGDGRDLQVIVSHPDIPGNDTRKLAKLDPQFRCQDEVVFVGWGHKGEFY